MFPKAAAATMVHSHVRPENSAQPSRSSRRTLEPASTTRVDGTPDRRDEDPADEVRERVPGEGPAGADDGDEDPAERRADDVRPGERQAEQRVRLLELGVRHGLRREPLRRREEERGGGAAHAVQRRQVPDLRLAGEHEHRDDGLRRRAHDVRADHHEVARKPIGDHSPEEEERDLRHRADREHDPEVGGRAAELEHRERQGDRRHRAARQRGEPTEEEQAERAVAERRERRAHRRSASRRLRQ